MKINLSRYAGFCDGVRRAYDMVMELDLAQAKKPVFVLGSLVHNEEVIGKIAQKGIDRIEREDFFNVRPGEVGTIVINAHGAGPDIFEKASNIGAEIVDTTCPKVIKVQKLAQAYARRGYKIIIVGDKNHKEVRGINEWGDKNAAIVSEEKDLESINFFPEEKIAVLSQTTQNEDFYKKISKAIKKKYKNAQIVFTTCHTTHARQSEVKELAEKNDAMVIIGSSTSANSRRLWEIASSINPRSYFVEKADGIKEEWFGEINSVGVTAGASTPKWIIDEALTLLEKIGKNRA